MGRWAWASGMGRDDRFGDGFEQVLAAARRDERWALEAIYRNLGRTVTGYLRAQGAVEPEDLASETFVGVLRNLDSFEGDEAAFRTWVFMIAHRRLLDERRRLRRRPPPEPLEQAPETQAPDDVEESVARALNAVRVRQLCERLAPDQRDVLLLRLLGSLTVEEVARALDKTPGAVKALQRRGFLAIGRQLEREGVPL
jgi:RNA polymerase sigma factor (sigma-70 family)